MIILDANAIYWYIGREKLGIPSSQPVDQKKLCTFLDSTNQKCIPATVYMEIITHFRDDPSRLKMITSFIINKGIKIHNNYSECFISADEMHKISLMPNCLLSCYAQEKLNKKIQIESELSIAFLEVIRILYAYYLLERTTLFSTDETERLLWFIGHNSVNERCTTNKTIINTALNKGYADGEEEKVLKNTYIDLLTEECISINLFLEAAIQVKNNNQDIVKALQTKNTELLNSGLIVGNPETKTMNAITSELSADSAFLQYSIQRISGILHARGFLPYQCTYVKNIMLPAWLIRGQKIRKNDIFDMLCVGSLNCQNDGSCTRLISFDGTMKSFLAKTNLLSYALIKEFE